MTERDSRHPAWGDLSLSGVQTLAPSQYPGGPFPGWPQQAHLCVCRAQGAGVGLGVQGWRWEPSTAARSLPTTLELRRTDCPGVCTCRAGYRHEQPQERSWGWPHARHQAFGRDMAWSGALQAKDPGIHPDEVGGACPDLRWAEPAC